MLTAVKPAIVPRPKSSERGIRRVTSCPLQASRASRATRSDCGVTLRVCRTFARWAVTAVWRWRGEAPLFCSDLHCDIGDACPCGNVPEAMEACLPVTSHSFSQSSGPVCVNAGSVHLAGEQTRQILSILSFEKWRE